MQNLSAATAPISLSTHTLSPINNTSFNLSFGAGLAGNPAAQQAFTNAAARWSAVLADPVALNIDVDYQPLSPGVLGQASSAILVGGYTTVRNLVANGGDSGASYESLLPQLPTADQVSILVPYNVPYWSGLTSLTQVNYLALGGVRQTPKDGSITFSSNFSWDFDPDNGVNAGTFDFEGIAVHEIGHILGFVSDVDEVDYCLRNGLNLDPEPTPLDFFRFRTSDLGPGFDFTTTPRMLAPGGSQSFYYGGSVLMSTGKYYGDGRQASHWKDNLSLGVMDPTAAAGEVLNFTANDLIAMDLIGWQVVPEPSTLVLLLMGAVGLVLYGWRRRKLL